MILINSKDPDQTAPLSIWSGPELFTQTYSPLKTKEHTVVSTVCFFTRPLTQKIRWKELKFCTPQQKLPDKPKCGISAVG